ncbi:MAG: PIG-L deacetylase family protein [Pseudomonadales bacterium]
MMAWRGLEGLRTVLCLGAHCDDIEIGCGGLLQCLPAGIELHAVVFSGNEIREAETRQAISQLAGQTSLSIAVQNHPDGRFPSAWESIKRDFEALKTDLNPDLILTHHRQDKHQDHRVVAELTWNTWRNHTILEYEILKYDDDLSTPNVFLPLKDAQATKKAGVVVSTFRSQAGKAWMTEDALLALMRVRGVQVQERYAEGYYAPKLRI